MYVKREGASLFLGEGTGFLGDILGLEILLASGQSVVMHVSHEVPFWEPNVFEI